MPRISHPRFKDFFFFFFNLAFSQDDKHAPLVRYWLSLIFSACLSWGGTSTLSDREAKGNQSLVSWPVMPLIELSYYQWRLSRRRELHMSQVFSSLQCPTFWDPMDCSTPGLPIHHQLPELAQTHVHWVGDAIQPFHPLLCPSPPAFNVSQHQGLFKWFSSSHQVAKVLEFQLQHRSFQWTPRTDLL